MQRDTNGTTRGSLMLAADAVDHLAARVHEFHRAISDIPFTVLKFTPVRPASHVVGQVHDGITDGVYRAVRAGSRIAFQVAGGLVQQVPPALPPPRRDTRRDDLPAILSGFVGDRMARQRNPLVSPVGLYRDGHRVRATRDALAQAFPQASSRVVVFLHGLCGNENVWKLFERAGDALTRPYGMRLQEDLGSTALYLRYNSGLHVSHNGRALARWLEDLAQHWPVKIDSLVLIGHSMGGLVARSAAQIGHERQHGWVGRLDQVICLGTPHLGAPLEKFVHLATHALHRSSLGRPLARLLDARSHGIKDLRWGYTQDREIRGRDPDALWRADRLQGPPVPGVRYRFIGTSLGANPQGLLARTLGDGLVRLPSSLATGVAQAEGAESAGLHHMQLLNHPEVYARIRDWLAEGAAPRRHSRPRLG